MFTGIITGRGTVTDISISREPGLTRLLINTHGLSDDLQAGGSLAVNGVCLTALPDPDHTGVFSTDLMGETLERTNLGSLRAGDTVNLERCLSAGQRLDGHIVQGHVDAVGTVTEIAPQGRWTTMRVAVPRALEGQIAEKGSIAVDGVSLTVTCVSRAGVDRPWFEVGLIPATLQSTRLGRVAVGEGVNIETDVLAKYLRRLTLTEQAGQTEQAEQAGQEGVR